MPETTSAVDTSTEETAKPTKAEAKAAAKAAEEQKAETARLAKDNDDLRAQLAKLANAVEALTAAKAEVAKEDTAAAAPVSPYRPVTLRNLKAAPFYYDDINGANTPDKGIAMKNPVRLTEKQWLRRSPAQWGVLAANDTVSLEGIPAGDLEAFEAARAAEDVRLNNVRTYDEVERSILAGKHSI